MAKKGINEEKEEDELIEAASVYNYDHEIDAEQKDGVESSSLEKAETQHVPEKNSSKTGSAGKGAKIFYVVSALVILLLIIFLGIYMYKLFVPRDSVVALVNDEAITEIELITKFALLPSTLRPTITKEVLLNQSIIEKLLGQEAKKAGFTVSGEEVETYYSLVASQSGMSAEELDQQILGANLSRESLLDVYEERLLIGKYLNDTIVNTIIVSDGEIQQFFDSNKDLLVRDDEVRASHILVETLEEADEVLQELKSGINFADVANQKSIDSGSGVNGGDLGFFSREVMVKPFADAAFTLEVGQVSNPIQTQFGYHVILVTDKREGGDVSLDSVRDQIYDAIFARKQQDTLALFVDGLFKKADILIVHEEFKVLDDTPKIEEVVEREVEEPKEEEKEEKVEPEIISEITEPVVEPEVEEEEKPVVEEEKPIEKIEVSSACGIFSSNSVVYYYANWCSGCLDLLPYVQSQAKQHDITIVEESNDAIIDKCFDKQAGLPQLICYGDGNIQKGKISEKDVDLFLESCS